jgi:outer membrane lipoprotein-sorting protein
MKIGWSLTWSAITLGVLASAAVHAELAGKEFSAEMVQRGPGGQISSGRMYVGDDRMRTEMEHQGQQLVRITDEERGVEWILFPEQQTYMERTVPAAPPGGAGPRPAEAAVDPCGGMPGLACRKLGEETIAGRPAVKWEMVFSHEGQAMKSTQWIDKERGVPLRQEMPGGQTTALELVGMETLDGRQVEKWEVTSTQPGGTTNRTFQWYDPELQIAVRQEFPGGLVSELKNIRVGEQPDHLFSMPAGYERISVPQAMPSGGAPGQPPR